MMCYNVSLSVWTIFRIFVEVDMSMNLSPISTTSPPMMFESICKGINKRYFLDSLRWLVVGFGGELVLKYFKYLGGMPQPPSFGVFIYARESPFPNPMEASLPNIFF